MTTPQPFEATESTPTRPTRSMTVLILLLGGVLALIGATQTWVSAAGFEAAHIDQVQLSGQEASPVITAMALVIIAAGAALSIARKIGRWIVGVIAIMAALTLGWATINVITDPLGAVALKIAETTGTTGVAEPTAQLDVSALPWLTVAGAIIALAGGLITVLIGRRWPVGKTKKYDVGQQQQPQQTERDGPLDEIDTWDELSRGEDPT